MKNNCFVFFAFFFLLFLVTSCVNNQNNNAIKLTAKAGENFTVKLDSNPTTGYQWQIKEIDNSLVWLIDASFIPPKTDLVGAGGEQAFTFQAQKNGKTKLVFVYLRPWEKDVAPIKQQLFEVYII